MTNVRYAKFYRTRDKWGDFSNFVRRPITLDAKVWPSSEHYYQAKKAIHEIDAETIRSLPSPKEAAEMGRTIECRPDWNEHITTLGISPPVQSVRLVKDWFMWQALVAKFTQHEDLKKVLVVDSDDMIIVEHTVNDRYWGDNGDGTGLNMLGNQLMDLRVILGGKHAPILLPVIKTLSPHTAADVVGAQDMMKRDEP